MRGKILLVIVCMLVSIGLFSGCITNNATVSGTVSSVSISGGHIKIRFTSGGSMIFNGDLSTYEQVETYEGKLVEIEIKDSKLYRIIDL